MRDTTAKESRYGYEFIEDVGYVVHDNKTQSYVAALNTEREAREYCQPTEEVAEDWPEEEAANRVLYR